MKSSRAALILLAGLAASCSTPTHDAYRELEEGRYMAAENAFHRIVLQDPGDTHAVAGLRLAREKYLESCLQEARAAREAQALERSWTALTAFQQQRAHWKMETPERLVELYQAELRMALDRIDGQVRSDLAEGRPLAAERLLLRHAPVLGEEPSGRWKALGEEVRQAGARSCQASLKQARAPYGAYAGMVARLCARFGIQVPEAVEKTVDRDEASYYRAIQCELQVADLPRPQVLLAGDALHKAIARTPWFDPHGRKVLQLVVAGRARAGERMSLTLLGRVRLGGRTVQLGLAEQAPAASAPTADWLNGRIQAFAADFERKSTALWRDLHCAREPGSRASDAARGDAAIRCVRGLPESEAPPAWAEAWYQRYLGLAPREAHQILEEETPAQNP